MKLEDDIPTHFVTLYWQKKSKIHPNNASKPQQRKSCETYYKTAKNKCHEDYNKTTREISNWRDWPLFAPLLDSRGTLITASSSDNYSAASASLAANVRTSARKLEIIATQFVASRCMPTLQPFKAFFISTDAFTQSKRKPD